MLLFLSYPLYSKMEVDNLKTRAKYTCMMKHDFGLLSIYNITRRENWDEHDT